MTTDILEEHRLTWKAKPVLRAIYQDYYERMLVHTQPGPILEIGGGSGNLKEYRDQVVSTDIVFNAWLDATCDAQALPFLNDSFDNIMGIDVLHHIEHPVHFFQESQRILKPGGRIVLIEPAITVVSWFFYHFFHPEPVILNAKPLTTGSITVDRNPFDANQAIPELLFGQHLKEFKTVFPKLHLIHKTYLNLWCYPLSGGFRPWSLIPRKMVEPLLKLEKKLETVLGKFLGFRLLLVLEKEA